MAALATPISEDWIRERVGLDHENLEDVKSLALPGTYHEKITSLGKSLHKFTRLKSLDLSRNSLDTLQGLENCTLLENVNLYYNNLSTLEDVAPLRFNSTITNLDLRLNPVARTEADYRLFVVNILPNLKILDDRPVRESEREAATSHFSSTESKDEREASKPTKSTSSKSRIIPSGIVSGSTMDAEDRAVLTLLANCEAGLPQNTGSSVTMPVAENYQLSELKALGERELGVAEASAGVRFAPELDNERASYYQARYPNIPTHRLSEIAISDVAKQEVDAYTSYKGQGHFTPNPDILPEATSQKSSSPGSANVDGQHNSGSGDCADPNLISLLDLVDKYWNGSKSLHDNKKFMKLAADIHANIVAEGSAVLRTQIQQLKKDNSELLNTALANEGLKRVKVKLDQSEVEMNKLRSDLTELQSENNKLRLALHTQKETNAPVKSLPGASSRELEELRHENHQLQFKLKQYSQMSELAKMLQESHKSLVQTNDHLLKEINEMRSCTNKINGHS